MSVSAVVGRVVGRARLAVRGSVGVAWVGGAVSLTGMVLLAMSGGESHDVW